jgi:hypothetical protein
MSEGEISTKNGEGETVKEIYREEGEEGREVNIWGGERGGVEEK